MFKFNVKINNTHSFKTISNNTHKFKTVINNTFEFILKSTNTTIINKLDIHEKTKSGLTIGSKTLGLSLFEHTKLKDLPNTLRQFTGAYTYVKAKARFSSIVNGISAIHGKAITKGSLRNNSNIDPIVSDKVIAKVRNKSNDMESDVKIKLTRTMKGKISESLSYVTGKMLSVLRTKARGGDITLMSHQMDGSLIAKVRAIINSNTKVSVMCYQGKCKKISIYSESKLSDLPVTLKGMCFDFANENWNDVIGSNRTWGDVKANVSSWDNLMN